MLNTTRIGKVYKNYNENRKNRFVLPNWKVYETRQLRGSKSTVIIAEKAEARCSTPMDEWF